MARSEMNLDEEKRSYGTLWLVLSLLLLVGGIWTVADDNVFRRPWKRYQGQFGRLEIERIKKAIADEQAKLDADPAYQAAAKALDEAKASVEHGTTAQEIAKLEARLAQARLDDQSKDLNLRFVKSELEELRFQYDDAKHHARPTDELQAKIEAREQLRTERQKTYGDSQAGIQDLENQIKQLKNQVKVADDAIAKLTTARDELQQKLETVSLGYYPGPKATPPFFGSDWQPKIPKIQQVVMPQFDRNNFDQPIDRVDRCTTCHSGINKAGFDDVPQPWTTHPKREVYLGNHPTEKFGCTPCHGGQGPAVNSVEHAHGNFYDPDGHLENVEFIDTPLFRDQKMQTNCIKCHADVQNLPEAGAIARGEYLFVEMGCVGCHLAEGYEDASKQQGVSAVGPSLRRLGAKVDRAWLVRWITNPHEFRPRTRMPNFLFDQQQATAIAAWLLAASKEPSDAWLAEAAPAPAGADAQVARGKEIVDSVGCRACHALAPDEVAGQLGANKDKAPNLANVAEKTGPRWVYNWVRNPRHFSQIARMPSLRLSDEEAAAVTAYVMTLGAKKPGPPDLDAQLANPDAIAAGEKLARKYGCAGCHEIPGFENESRIGAELSNFGAKTKEELFFGDRADLHETWDEWTFNKLKEPRTYQTKWIEQLMPQFDLADEDIKALMVFLASRTDQKVPAKYVYHGFEEQAVVGGQWVIARYNCKGCHVINGHGGDVRRLYEEAPTLAPPILNGEGEKVQAQWLYTFLRAPTPIRPWLKIRMPTFGLDDHEDLTIGRYFRALDDVDNPFVYVERAALDPQMVEAGKLLMSKDYFDCFSCHQRGAQKPQGPPEGWAPDLSLAAKRLNPQWIVKWLEDPQKVMPGTKMPSFYPGGPPDILGGDEPAQIRAMRDYILSLGLPQLTPPPTQTAAAPG